MTPNQETPAKPIIQLVKVSKVYGRGAGAVKALKGVDLSIQPGEFVAVMGPSGSGKSTCLNLLGCLDTPSGGKYLFRGVEVGGLNRNQLAMLRRKYLGFVFQGFNLLKRTSALENVVLPLIYRGLPRAARKKLAAKSLSRVGLTGWETHSPAELSGGQQQRVAIARAMVSSPDVLLADEPTGNLDSVTSNEIMGLISSLNREQGQTIILVTHEPDMAAYASRVVTFRDGLIESDRRSD